MYVQEPLDTSVEIAAQWNASPSATVQTPMYNDHGMGNWKAVNDGDASFL
jgi:metal-dependent HD superfamily phosphatase/phosphodiesterase